jgi:hypothetical protein
MHLARALAASDTRLGADTAASLLLGGLFRPELMNFSGVRRGRRKPALFVFVNRVSRSPDAAMRPEL